MSSIRTTQQRIDTLRATVQRESAAGHTSCAALATKFLDAALAEQNLAELCAMAHKAMTPALRAFTARTD